MEKKIPPPCIQTPQKNQANFREMLGRILWMVLMKEKEEQLFNGQWLKRTEHTTCAAGSSQKDEWWVMPPLRQAWPQSCWMNEKGGLIIWMGKNKFASESICTFGLKSTDFRWLGDQTALLRKMSSTYLLQQVWVLCFMLEKWHEGELMWGASAPGTDQTELQDVFLLHTALFSPSHKEGLQAQSGIVAQNLRCKMLFLLCVVCLCLTVLCNLDSGSLCA